MEPKAALLMIIDLIATHHNGTIEAAFMQLLRDKYGMAMNDIYLIQNYINGEEHSNKYPSYVAFDGVLTRLELGDDKLVHGTEVAFFRSENESQDFSKWFNALLGKA